MSEGQAAAQASGTTGQTEGSAPQSNDGKTNGSGQVESAPKQNGNAAPGVKREFFQLREKVRTEREEKESLRAELDALKAQLNGVGRVKAEKVDPLEDPEAYLGEAEKRARKAAGEEFNTRLAQHNRMVNAVQSEEWLRSRSHLENDGKAADEVAKIIESDYLEVAEKNPRAAARSAYVDWCESKGVTPDLSSTSSLTPPRHAKASAAGVGSSLADKTYTPDEVKRTLAGLSSPEARKAYTAEVEKAAREGRYKGKVIKL